MMNLNGCTLISIDTETTGLTPGYHEIYQVGAVVVDHNLEIAKDRMPLDLWMRPDHLDRIDPKAMNLTKENFFEKLAMGVSQERGIELFEYWVEKQVRPNGKKIMLMGQNIAQHDIPFLRTWLGNHYYNETFHHHVRDTMLTAIHLNDVADWLREVFPFPRVGLRNLMSYLGRECVELRQHDAVYDASCVPGIYKDQVRHYLNEMRKGHDSNGQTDHKVDSGKPYPDLPLRSETTESQQLQPPASQ